MKTRRHGSVTAFVVLFYKGLLRSNIHHPAFVGTVKMRYEEYLKTNRWKKKRKQVRRLYKRCMICGSIDNLQVHHRGLSTVGRENVYTDLSLFCKKCTSLFPERENPVVVTVKLPSTQTELRNRVLEIRAVRRGH